MGLPAVAQPGNCKRPACPAVYIVGSISVLLPQASVVAALSRDIIFARVAPGTYALQAVVSYHQCVHTASAHR